MPKHVTNLEIKNLLIYIIEDGKIDQLSNREGYNFLKEASLILAGYMNRSNEQKKAADLLCRYFGGEVVSEPYKLFHGSLHPYVIDIAWNYNVPEDGGIWKIVDTDQTIQEWKNNDIENDSHAKPKTITGKDIEYDFTCPTCSHHIIEEVTLNVIQSIPVTKIKHNKEDGLFALNYDQEASTTEVTDTETIYACTKCGHKIELDDYFKKST